MENMAEYIGFTWIIVMIVGTIVEVITSQLVSIWFVLGAIIAFSSSFFIEDFWLQVIVFALVTLISLILTRPFVKRFLNVKTVRTNADRVIGKIAVVIKDIANDKGKGQVNVEGEIWSAKAEDGSNISMHEYVRVKRIEGIKLIVSKIEKDEVL